MQEDRVCSCTAFDGNRLIASGTLVEVARCVKEAIDRKGDSPVLIFDDRTSEVIDVDYRGTVEDVVNRLIEEVETDRHTAGPAVKRPAPRRGPGRPKLGVVSREVTLLPQHWEWLKSQPGGASATLRRLVHDAKKRNHRSGAARRSAGVAYRFMSIMAGNRPGYEEATRSLFAGDRERFVSLTSCWPADIRQHVLKLAASAFPGEVSADLPDRQENA